MEFSLRHTAWQGESERREEWEEPCLQAGGSSGEDRALSSGCLMNSGRESRSQAQERQRVGWVEGHDGKEA